MKTIKYLPLALAAAGMMFSACSSDDTVAETPTSNDVSNAYIAVDIQGVGGMPSSRAAVGPGYYEDGDPANEGRIGAIRFYFFNSDNSIYNLPTEQNNYIQPDFTTATDTLPGDDSQTIERKTRTVIALRGINGSLPDKIVAVINPGTSLDSKEINNLSDLTSAGLTTTAYQTSGQGFIMSNSVYKDQDDVNGTNISYTKLSSSNFKTSEQEALDDASNAAQVYVERVAARVDVKKPASVGETSPWSTANFAIDGGTAAEHDIYNLNTTYTYRTPNSATTTTSDNVYFVLEGWGLADENNNASLFKNLGTGYNIDTDVNGTEDPWTAMSYRRSFWETSSEYHPVRYTFAQYTAGARRIGGTTYTMPNTPTEDNLSWNNTNRRTDVADVNAQAPTKVVLAGRLMTHNDATNTWNELEICRYRGQNFLDSVNVKDAILSDLVQDAANNVYVATPGTGTTGYRSLSRNDFHFVVVGNPGKKESYRLEARLNSLAAGSSYCTRTGNSSYTNISSEQAQTSLNNVAGNDIEIYKGGRTYYYTTIQHLWFPKEFKPAGTSTGSAASLTNDSNLGLGSFGIVRNHLYQVTINTISGFGTPVYDPNQEIIPVTPSDQSSYLAAQVNVLQWRQVSQDVDIDGNTQK